MQIEEETRLLLVLRREVLMSALGRNDLAAHEERLAEARAGAEDADRRVRVALSGLCCSAHYVLLPWLTFEESTNRYRVLGPFFAERLGLIPGATDLGASIRATVRPADVHVGVYNGEGQGRAEVDKYKSIDGRATFRPFSEDSELGKVTISGFYQYGWYAQRPPAQRGHRDGQLRERPHLVPTAQYLSATDNPFVAVDVAAPRPVVLRRRPAGSRPAGPGLAVWISSTRTRTTTATRRAAWSSAARTGVR